MEERETSTWLQLNSMLALLLAWSFFLLLVLLLVFIWPSLSWCGYSPNHKRNVQVVRFLSCGFSLIQGEDFSMAFPIDSLNKNSRNNSVPGKKILEPAWIRPKLQMSPNFQTRVVSWWVTVLARAADSPCWEPSSLSYFLQDRLICPLPSWHCWVALCKVRLSSQFVMLATTKNMLLLKCVQSSAPLIFISCLGSQNLILRLEVRLAVHPSWEILLVSFSKSWGYRWTPLDWAFTWILTEDTKSGPCACMAGPLSTEPSP